MQTIFAPELARNLINTELILLDQPFHLLSIKKIDLEPLRDEQKPKIILLLFTLLTLADRSYLLSISMTFQYDIFGRRIDFGRSCLQKSSSRIHTLRFLQSMYTSYRASECSPRKIQKLQQNTCKIAVEKESQRLILFLLHI